MDIAEQIWEDAGAVLYEHRHELQDPANWNPILAFDRPRIHDVDQLLERIKMVEEAVVDMCHYAGDMQKVIEHCHANNQRVLSERVLDLGTKGQYKGKFWHDELCRTHMHENSVESLRKDVLSLPATYKHISAPIDQGGSAGKTALPPYN